MRPSVFPPARPFTEPEVFAGLADVAARMHQPNASFYGAVARGDVGCALFIHPATNLPRDMISAAVGPCVMVVADDPPATASEAIGPDPWCFRRRLRAWRPMHALVHATGAQPWHFERTLATARAFGRVLLIETGSAQARAWVNALEPLCPITVIVPPAGGVHPIAETRH